MTKFTIREANESNYAAMCHIHIAAIQAIDEQFYTKEMKSSWATGLRPEGYSNGQQQGEYYRVAVNAENDVCGWSSAKAETLMALYVHPDEQGKGIGTLMLNDYEQRILASGLYQAILTASLNAKKFYASRGWMTQSFDMFQSRGGLMLSTVKMTKSLLRESGPHVH